MTIVIELYIVICIALLLFDLGFLYIKKKRTEVLYPRNNRLAGQIHREMGRYSLEGSFSPHFMERLVPQLSKVRNLITLVSEIQEDPRLRSVFAPYIFQLIQVYSRRNESEKAYYAYVISLLDYDPVAMPPDFPGRFMELLDSGSVYTFSNAMNALYHFGQTNLLIQALDKVNERGEFYHKKLLIDGLLASRRDCAQFNPMVLERFDGYCPYLQAALLDYFRMSGWDVSELCYRLLIHEDADEEVRCSAMRYFARFPTSQSDSWFLQALEDPHTSWLFQMLAIQALGSDSSPRVREVIRSKITSPDWYVRVNAARYLYRHKISRKEIYDILQLRDRYASDILLYCCEEDPELTDYILKILAQQQAESEKKDSSVSLTPALAGTEGCR